MFNFFHVEGIEAFNQRDYVGAKIAFIQAIKENRKCAKSYLFLGKAHFFCGEKKKALFNLKYYIYLMQDNSGAAAEVSYAYDVAAQCYGVDNKDKAIKCYKAAVKTYEFNASAWHNFGLYCVELAQNHLQDEVANGFNLFQKAQVYLNNALEIYAINPMFLHSMAGWYEKYAEAREELAMQENIGNNFILALEYYQKAIEACDSDDISLKNIINANRTECLAQYGHHFYKSEDYEMALALYSQTIESDPKHLVAINQAGMSLFKLDRFSEARKYFTDILDNTTDTQELADAWLNIACTHRLEKSWGDAEKALQEAREKAPQDPFIMDEENKLNEWKAQACLTEAPQTFFARSQLSSDAPTEENQFQLQ